MPKAKSKRRDEQHSKNYIASLGLDPDRCVFCNQKNTREEVYGKVIRKCGLTVHYFCMLFSSGLGQNGKSQDFGIFGFLPEDILKEVRRGLRLRCSFCKKMGATIGCVMRSCRKMFHFGCGQENGTMHQYFDTFSSFCEDHRPKQMVPIDRLSFTGKVNVVCAICMTTVTPRATNDTLRAPCCRNSWFHRSCIQRHATAAGLYFFKCPLCNNKDMFQDEMLQYGIYIPDQDAAWEREPNAYTDLHQRYLRCDSLICRCPTGPEYNKDGGKWEVVVCDWCGSKGTHVACHSLLKVGRDYVCNECKDIDDRYRKERKLKKMKKHRDFVMEYGKDARTAENSKILEDKFKKSSEPVSPSNQNMASTSNSVISPGTVLRISLLDTDEEVNVWETDDSDTEGHQQPSAGFEAGCLSPEVSQVSCLPPRKRKSCHESPVLRNTRARKVEGQVKDDTCQDSHESKDRSCEPDSLPQMDDYSGVSNTRENTPITSNNGENTPITSNLGDNLLDANSNILNHRSKEDNDVKTLNEISEKHKSVKKDIKVYYKKNPMMASYRRRKPRKKKSKNNRHTPSYGDGEWMTEDEESVSCDVEKIQDTSSQSIRESDVVKEIETSFQTENTSDEIMTATHAEEICREESYADGSSCEDSATNSHIQQHLTCSNVTDNDESVGVVEDSVSVNADIELKASPKTSEMLQECHIEENQSLCTNASLMEVDSSVNVSQSCSNLGISLDCSAEETCQSKTIKSKYEGMTEKQKRSYIKRMNFQKKNPFCTKVRKFRTKKKISKYQEKEQKNTISQTAEDGEKLQCVESKSDASQVQSSQTDSTDDRKEDPVPGPSATEKEVTLRKSLTVKWKNKKFILFSSA